MSIQIIRNMQRLQQSFLTSQPPLPPKVALSQVSNTTLTPTAAVPPPKSKLPAKPAQGAALLGNLDSTPITPAVQSVSASTATKTSTDKGIELVKKFKEGKPLLITTLQTSINNFSFQKFNTTAEERKKAYLKFKKEESVKAPLSSSITFNNSPDKINKDLVKCSLSSSITFNNSPDRIFGDPKTKMVFGFILNHDQVEIQNAFLRSPVTYDMPHKSKIVHKPNRKNGKPNKSPDCLRSYLFREDFSDRDKKYKIVDGKPVERSNAEIMNSMQRHIRKGRDRHLDKETVARKFTDLLLLPRNKPEQMVDGVFLDLLFKPSISNLFRRRYNTRRTLRKYQKEIQILSDKTPGLPIMVFTGLTGSKKRKLSLIEKNKQGNFVLSKGKRKLPFFLSDHAS